MYRLTFARAEYHALRQKLEIDVPDIDEKTLADTIEGLTDMHEIVAAIIRSALADEAMVSGLKGRIDEMQGRLARFEDRISKRRQIARDVMIDTQIKTITAPDFTVSVRPGPDSLAVLDEAAIPKDFWEAREPRLNRQALLSELKRGISIEGAALSNQGPVISVRTK